MRTKSVVATYLGAEARLLQSNRELFRRASLRIADSKMSSVHRIAVAVINSIDAGARFDDGAADRSFKSTVMPTEQRV